MNKTVHISPASISLNILLKDRLKIISEHGFEIIGFSTNDKDGKEFQSGGFKFIPSQHLTRQFSITKDIRFFFECYKIFKREKPDIVNTYGPKPGLYARIAAGLAGVPIIIHTSWGLFFSEKSHWTKKWLIIALEKFSALFCDYVFSVNKDDYNLMKKYRFKGSKQTGYLGNGTDIIKKFNPNLYNKVEKKDKIVIGSVGRLTKAKGFMELFHAAKEIKKKYPNVIFSIVGIADNNRNGGISYDFLSGLIKTGVIELHPPKPNYEMPLFYSSIDIMILPSHREGFPRSLVEAAAMGKPIITTDTRGCREAVENGYNGLMVPISDVKALTKAIEKLIINHELRKKMGTNSRIKAEKEFDEIALINKILFIYNCLISNKLKSYETNP